MLRFFVLLAINPDFSHKNTAQDEH
ncbi:hypothetical protein AGR1A_Cc10158 [Agrobacterium fabacearum CFBP 5771]|nr:hypothetical protein AGR1A_Cc10158 [Agrobacterium fabacearum CFBP 5771]